MAGETTFRIVLLLLFAAFVGNRAYYHGRYRPTEGDEVSEPEPGAGPRLVNLLSLAALLSAAAYIVRPDWLAWASLPLPVWLRWLGVVVGLLGFGLLQWSHRALGQNWSDAARLKVDHTLVTNGPYRWIRHPIYTAFILILGSTLLIAANWFIGLAWLAVMGLDARSRVALEEKILQERFGDDYRAYMKRSGRFLPRIGS